MKKHAWQIRIAAAVLAVLMLAGCAGSNPETPDGGKADDATVGSDLPAAEAVPETEADPLDPAVLYDGLPAEGYGGYDFLMLIRQNARWIADMAADEMNGEAINDAIYQRNSMVADRFDVTIRYEESSNYNYETDAMTSIRAGDDAYDLVIPHGRASFLYANQMLCLDWNTALPYVALDSPWWSQDARSSFSILGKLFVMNGDISYNSLGSADVMLFNKQLMTDLGLPFPYETVREGGWTYDLWTTQVEGAAADLNGDGKIEENNDRLGYVTQKWVGPMEAFATSGLRVLSKDDDDVPYLSFYSEKTVDVFNRYFALIDSDAAYVDTADVSYSSGFINIFEEARALFTDMNMTDVITLRTMEADFGVIPWPKYDEGSEYCTNVDAGTNLFLVPITASDPARTSVILESLCRIGSRLVLPAYYEVTLQSKTSRDNESADMLDIIKSALIFDLGYYNSDLSGVFNNEFVDFVGSSNRDITSWYEKSAKAVNKTLEKNIDKYRD